MAWYFSSVEPFYKIKTRCLIMAIEDASKQQVLLFSDLHDCFRRLQYLKRTENHFLKSV